MVPWKVRPLRMVEQGRDWVELGIRTTRNPCVSEGTHVSSCVESCGRVVHSPRRHCRKAQSVAFASCVMRLRSFSVHTSRPVNTT